MARLKRFYLIYTSSKNFDNKELFLQFQVPQNGWTKGIGAFNFNKRGGAGWEDISEYKGRPIILVATFNDWYLRYFKYSVNIVIIIFTPFPFKVKDLLLGIGPRGLIQ